MSGATATLKYWLDSLGFDWASGRIIYQHTEEGCAPGWTSPESAEQIASDHVILTTEFDCRSGAPKCPRIVAEDKDAIYFPSQYDGATSLEMVWKDLDRYLDFENNETPYPGG